MFPLSLLKTMNSLRFSSFFGVASIIYLVLAAFIHAALHDEGNPPVSSFSPKEWGSTALLAPLDFVSVVQAMPIMMFAFTCQVNVFAIYSELERASVRKMSTVSGKLCFDVCTLMTTHVYQSGFKRSCRCLLFRISCNGGVWVFWLFDWHPAKYSDKLLHQKTKGAVHVGSIFCNCDDNFDGFPFECVPLSIHHRNNACESFQSFDDFFLHARWVDIIDIWQCIDGSQRKPPRLILRFLPLSYLFCVCLVIQVSLFVPNISVVFQLMGGTSSAFVCFVVRAFSTTHDWR